jgi:hypothetical protein
MHWIALAVIAFAMFATRKPRRDVKVIFAPNVEANWFPTADGLRSEMWH